MIFRNVRSKCLFVFGSGREDFGGGEMVGEREGRQWFMIFGQLGLLWVGGFVLVLFVLFQFLDSKQVGCFLFMFDVFLNEFSLDQLQEGQWLNRSFLFLESEGGEVFLGFIWFVLVFYLVVLCDRGVSGVSRSFFGQRKGIFSLILRQKLEFKRINWFSGSEGSEVIRSFVQLELGVGNIRVVWFLFFVVVRLVLVRIGEGLEYFWQGFGIRELKFMIFGFRQKFSLNFVSSVSICYFQLFFFWILVFV